LDVRHAVQFREEVPGCLPSASADALAPVAPLVSLWSLPQRVWLRLVAHPDGVDELLAVLPAVDAQVAVLEPVAARLEELTLWQACSALEPQVPQV
jgi:hypothetical protein